MGTIPTLSKFTAGTPIVASVMNSHFEAIVTAVNGQLNDANIQQISAGKVTSGEFDPDRIPRLSEAKLPQAAQGFLKAKGATADPAYELVQWGDVQAKPAQATRWPAWGEVTDKPTTATRWPTWDEVDSKPSTFPPEGHQHNAGDINTGRLSVAQLPTSPVANLFIKVAEANGPPAYRPVLWTDVQDKPSTYPPSAHNQDWGTITDTPASYPPSAHSANLLTSGTVPIARIATGATNNTHVAPGQGMTGTGDARHPVGAIRLIAVDDTAVAAGNAYTSVRIARLDTFVASYDRPGGSGGSSGGTFVQLRSAGTVLPGAWQMLTDGRALVDTGSSYPGACLGLAVRIS